MKHCQTNSSNFSSYFSSNVRFISTFIMNYKSLKLVEYKIIIYSTTGVLDIFLNLSRH